MKNRTDVIFLLLVIVSFFFPGISTLVKISSGKSIINSRYERRELVSPADMKDAGSLKDTCRIIEGMVEDQLFIRDWIRTLYNRIMVFGFRHSTISSVVIGSDGFWFHVGSLNGSDLKFETVNDVTSESEINRLAASFINFSRRMADQNIVTSAVFIPTKITLYPEKLPCCYRKTAVKPVEKNAGRLVSAINNLNGSAAYPVNLADAIPMEDLYDRREFHWHRSGAQRLLYSLFSQENTLEPLNISPVPLSRLRVMPRRSLFDLSRTLGIGEVFYEKRTYVLPFNMVRYYNKKLRLLSRNFMRKEGFSRLYRSTNKNGLRILFISDSFGKKALTYIAQHFQDIVHVNFKRSLPRRGIVAEIVKIFPPDAILFLFHEGMAMKGQKLERLWSLEAGRGS